MTLSELRKEHPLFFKNCCVDGDTHHVTFLNYILYNSGCFITRETEWDKGLTTTDYRVWHYSEKDDLIRIKSRFKDIDCAQEFANNFRE